MARSTYHHGDLPGALIRAALDAVAEHGTTGLSIADVARRTGVSSAAPYRHFPDRRALLVATAAAAATDLAADLRAVRDDTAAAPDALAAAAAAYLRFLVRRRVGWDLVFADELTGAGDPGLSDAGRGVMDELLPLAVRVTGNPATALDLLEQAVAVAHGYGTFHLAGVAPRRLADVDQVAARVATAVHTLARAAVSRPQ